MSGRKTRTEGLEPGTVYVRKGGPDRAILEDGLQANRYDGENVWTQVFGFTDGAKLEWLTLEKRLARLEEESCRGEVYSGKSNLDCIKNPVEYQVGWLQSGDNWRQRNKVVFFEGKWSSQDVYNANVRRSRTSEELRQPVFGRPVLGR